MHRKDHQFRKCLKSLTLAIVFSLASIVTFSSSCFADSVDMAELMRPNPLGEISEGSEKAPVTIVHYVRLNQLSPFMKKYIEPYIKSGKVRYVLREMPLSLREAAGFTVARCAGKSDQTAYLRVVMELMADTEKWPQGKILEPLKAFAAKAGMDEPTFNACLTNADMTEKMKLLKSNAERLTEGKETLFVNGVKYDVSDTFIMVMDMPDKPLKKAIDAALRKGKPR